MKRKNGSGTLYRRGGRGPYYVKIEIGGKVVRRSTGTEDLAEARRQLDIMAKGHDLTDRERLAVVKTALEQRTSPTFEEAWQNYCAHPRNANQSAGAQQVDGGRWSAFVRWLGGYDGGPRCRINCGAAHPECMRLSDVSPAIAAEFVRASRANTSPSTLNRYVRICRRVWAFNRETPNPWEDFAPAPVDATKRRRLTVEELRTVVDAATGEMKKLMVIGLYTGLRLGDAVHLGWDRIEWAAGVVRLRPHKTVYSSGVWIRLPMHPRLKEALGRPKKSGPIMPEMSSWPGWKFSDAVQAHFEACGLAESVKRDGYRRRTAVVGFHSFRSTFISLMADAGVPLALVRALVGHIDEELTQLYYRAEEERAREEIAKLPGI